MPHDPQTMALYSSAGHWLVGAFVLAVALLIGLEASGRLREPPWLYAVPVVIVSSGAGLAAFVVFHAGIERAGEMLAFAISDRQQIQHLVIAGGSIFIGLSEWRARSSNFMRSTWRFAWPLSYVALGVGLMLHEQTGPHKDAVWLYHVLLGIVVVGAGLVRLAQVSRVLSWRLGGILFASVLMIEGTMLVLFQAPASF